MIRLIRVSLHKSSPRLIMLVLLAFAFGIAGHAQTTSGSESVAISGAPAGQTLDFNYTSTTINQECDGSPTSTNTTYNSFTFNGNELVGTAEGYKCGTEFTPDPASFLLPSSYKPGYTCYINFNPNEDIDTPYVYLSCTPE
jgi:hypothetical protein